MAFVLHDRTATGLLSRTARIATAVAVNVTVALFVLIVVKQYCRPLFEDWFGLGVWLIPALAHFVYLRESGLSQMLLVSVVSVLLTAFGALTIALAVFGDAP